MQKLGIPLIFLLFFSACSSLKTHEFRGPGERTITTPSPSKSESEPKSEESFSLDWPVAYVKINRGFSDHPKHMGLDLGGKMNSPIYAAHSGHVIYANKEFTGYGRLIIIENDNGWASFYGHLNRLLVKEGVYIKRGQEIAKMGKSGHATGVHLHFELRTHQKPVDPQKYLP